MKFSYYAAGIAVASAAWCKSRSRRYPLKKGYEIMNKFVIPGFFLSRPVIKLANHFLNNMKLPDPPSGICKEIKWIETRDKQWLKFTLYKPEKLADSIPCFIYFHGGGFCLEDAPYIHANVAEYAKRAKCMVAFLHYRTSDRYPFPVPFQDCCAGIEYIFRNYETLHIDKQRIAVGGDSAGGALAAACAQWCRDKRRNEFCFQMLIYPVMDARMKTESIKKYTDSPLWNAQLNKRMWKLYLRSENCGVQTYASPMETKNFKGLPFTYIEVEEFDCLHDEGKEYGQALKKAGVKVHLEEVEGTFHGFDVFRKTEITKKMIKKRSQVLSQIFWNQYRYDM